MPEILPKTLLRIILLSVSSIPPLHGQETMDLRGVWQVETPDQGTHVLIAKRNNLASRFRADNSDRTVHQGSWNSEAENVILQWDDGSIHRIERNLLGYQITHLDASENTVYTASATKLPEEILGQWAKAPTNPQDQMPDRNQATGFFGAWKTGTETDPRYLIVEPDRSAALSQNQQGSETSTLRGSWAKQGSELHIAFDSGQYGILKQNGRSFNFKLLAPGSLIEKSDADEMTATRIGRDLLPEEWHTLYAKMETTPKSAIFANRTDALSFYRGSWLVQRTEKTFERIEIGRFGGLKTSADDTLYGNWSMSGQDVFMNWDDGMRKILSSVGSGFLIYEYQPGRPIDGVPTLIFSAAPENVSKLARYINSEKTAAVGIIRRASAAGVTTNPENNSWGQKFIGWVWPFGDDQTSAQISGALLQPDDGAPQSLDPWWWPFWSENLPDKTVAESGPERHTVEIPVDAKSEPEATATRTSKPNWDWPF